MYGWAPTNLGLGARLPRTNPFEENKASHRSFNLSNRVPSETSFESKQKKQLEVPRSYIEEQRMLREAIRISQEEAIERKRPTKLSRNNNEPVAFSNPQNLCALNSILQILCPIAPFVDAILPFQMPKSGTEVALKMSPKKIEEIKKCWNFNQSLQQLFALKIFGNKLEANPMPVARSLPANEEGEELKFGAQQDVHELLMHLLLCLEDGLTTSEQLNQKSSSAVLGFKNLFLGNIVETLSCTQVPTFEKKVTREFGPTIINMLHGELVKDFREGLFSTVRNYQIDSKTNETIQKQGWVETPPKIMTFLIQRVQYGEDQKRVRSEESYNFPLDFPLDQFLMKNQKKLERSNTQTPTPNPLHSARNGDAEAEIEALKKKKQLLETAITCLEGYHNDGSINQKKIEMKVSGYHSNNFQKESAEYLLACDQEKKKLEELIENIMKPKTPRTERSFISSPAEMVYKLHGVIMHEGKAESGHYYALIYNHESEKWLKYDDRNVMELSKEEGYNLARGMQNVKKSQNGVSKTEEEKKSDDEYGQPCPYLLFYVKDKCEIYDFSKERIQDTLSKLLPKPQKEYIQQKNQLFKIECEQDRRGEISRIAKRVASEYESDMIRIKVLEKDIPYGTYQTELNPPTILSFSKYLFMEKSKCWNILCWHTLNEKIKASDIPYKDVINGDNDNSYYVELENLLLEEKSNYGFSSLELSDEEKELLRIKKLSYLAIRQFFQITEHLFHLIRERKWKEALRTVVLLHETVERIEDSPLKKEYLEFSKNIFESLLLKSTEVFGRNLKTLSPKSNGLKSVNTPGLLQTIVYCLNHKDALKTDSSIPLEITTKLKAMMTALRAKLSADEEKIFKAEIQKIEQSVASPPNEKIDSLIDPEFLGILLDIHDNGMFNQIERDFTDRKIELQKLSFHCKNELQLDKISTYDSGVRLETSTRTSGVSLPNVKSSQMRGNSMGPAPRTNMNQSDLLRRRY